MDNVYITHRVKPSDEYNALHEHNIQSDGAIRIWYRLVGETINPDETKAAFTRMEAQMQ